MHHHDHAVPVRDELDTTHLADYLHKEIPDLSGELKVRQFAKGYSNLTYLVQLGKHQMVLRRPPKGANIATAHDMEREYTVLTHLFPVYNKAPRPLLYCGDETVIGAPFYVMERRQGVILRHRPLEGVEMGQAVMKRLSQNLAACLAELHDLDLEASHLSKLGKPEGYVARQVKGWIERYAKAQTDDIESLQHVIPWLDQNQPGETRAALIHNDFKYDNVLLNDDLSEITTVLDWEMATVGDPLMDLGTTLAYWAEPKDPPILRAFGLTWMPGNLNREELVAHYAATTNREVTNPLFYYVFGLFKVAVIAQQIYARHQRGDAKDGRFANLIHVVHACGHLARHALEKDRLSNLFE